MRQRTLGRTGLTVSEVGFGAWAIGGAWGEVDESDAVDALHAAVDAGVTFFDTADVYGDGRSERLLARLRADRPDADIVIATKAGRRLDPHTADGYTAENLTSFVDRSLGNLETDTIDLLQLHCPPTEVYYRPEVFGALDDLVEAGKIRHYGVSVEKAEEGIKAAEYPGVETVQIVFNAFRQRPTELFARVARERSLGVIARVPLASGLLSGKMDRTTTFAPDDHRRFNREGEAFDVGETFGGVPFETGLRAVEELRPMVDEGTMAQFALRWILTHDWVSVAIPGAKNRGQAEANAAASDLDRVDEATMEEVRDVYDRLIAPHVHQRW